MKCKDCKHRFPRHLIHLFRGWQQTAHGQHPYARWLCPLCGLKEMRELHHDPTLEFQGEMNKANYAEALKLVTQPAPTEEGE